MLLVSEPWFSLLGGWSCALVSGMTPNKVITSQGQGAWCMVRERNGSVVNSWHICCTIPHHTCCVSSCTHGLETLFRQDCNPILYNWEKHDIYMYVHRKWRRTAPFTNKEPANRDKRITENIKLLQSLQYHTVCMDSVISLRNGHEQLSKIACLEMFGAWLLTCVISFFTWVSLLFSCVFLLCSSLTSSSILVIFLSKSYLMLKHFETILEESIQLLEQVIAKLIMRTRYY